MRVAKLLADKAAASPHVSATAYSGPTLGGFSLGGRVSRAFAVFIQLDEDPTAEDIDMDLQGRADDSSDWRVMTTYTGISHTYQNPTGTIRVLYTLQAGQIMPQVRFQVRSVSLSMNRINAWVFRY